ncbi:MAG: Lrp/AsnC ligand binding domain-containing protein [Candidatus Caldarchaeum sp.]
MDDLKLTVPSGLLNYLYTGVETIKRGIMPSAFVLINTEIGAEEEVVNELKKISYIKEAYVVYGVYDIVAKVEADSMEKLKEVVSWSIRRLEKVRSTLTMLVVSS